MIWTVIKAILMLQILAAVLLVIHAQANWNGELPDDDEDEDECDGRIDWR